MTWVILPASGLALFNPRGTIATQESQLLIVAAGLMVLVLIPVYILIITIAVRYRASNSRATYRPNWDSNRRLEALWWTIPLLVIGVLAGLTWVSTHQLDPARPISGAPPLVVQVVALQWKWLFIYPQSHVASVNLLELPVGRPVRFEITADAPMNSLWIPQLGGQIYAMPGMSTTLNLQADAAGDYRGVSANLSGAGFADMHFTARAVAPAKFDAWLSQVRAGGGGLDSVAYANLARHTGTSPAQTYAVAAGGLYDDIIMKYLTPDALATGADHAGDHE